MQRKSRSAGPELVGFVAYGKAKNFSVPPLRLIRIGRRYAAGDAEEKG